MSLSQQDKDRIESFRAFIEDTVGNDDRYGSAMREDQADGLLLATRFQAGPTCWFEVAVRPQVPQVRAGFLTDDRWKSEECEKAIEESGDSMEEFVGMGMQDAGLEWPKPPVEHFREAGRYFYFATSLALDELADLERDEIRDKTLRMLEGYLIAFGPAIAIEENGE